MSKKKEASIIFTPCLFTENTLKVLRGQALQVCKARRGPRKEGTTDQKNLLFGRRYPLPTPM